MRLGPGAGQWLKEAEGTCAGCPVDDAWAVQTSEAQPAGVSVKRKVWVHLHGCGVLRNRDGAGRVGGGEGGQRASGERSFGYRAGRSSGKVGWLPGQAAWPPSLGSSVCVVLTLGGVAALLQMLTSDTPAE